MVYTNKEIDSLILTGLHKGQNASKIMLLKTVLRYPEFGGTSICLICTLVKSFNECYYFKIVSIFKMWSHPHSKDIASYKGYFKVFPKRKRKILHAHLLSYFLCFSHDLLHFVMLLLTQSAPKTRILKFYNSFPTFWGKKWNLLFICHYSLLLFTVTIHLLLFMTLFTPKFCLFKGGCPLYFKKFFSVLSSGLLS